MKYILFQKIYKKCAELFIRIEKCDQKSFLMGEQYKKLPQGSKYI